jgi:hypothetical protein
VVRFVDDRESRRVRPAARGGEGHHPGAGLKLHLVGFIGNEPASLHPIRQAAVHAAQAEFQQLRGFVVAL